jgi:hypothetical protein
MAPNQPRPKTGEKAKPYPISLYWATIDQLNEIQRVSGESHGAIVRRLVDREAQRVRKVGISKAWVWTFPGYRGDAEPGAARVAFRRRSGDDLFFDAISDRITADLPIGSYVVINWTDQQLRGQVDFVERVDVDGSPVVMVTVREVQPPGNPDVHPVLYGYVLGLNEEIAARSAHTVTFNPNRMTPSWVLAENEVRAMLVGPPKEPARSIRFLPFSGPTFQDHLNPVGDHFPVVDIEDDGARADAVERIVRFLENGSALPRQPQWWPER